MPRCIGCNSRVANRKMTSERRCPSCGHQFVADPGADGVGDTAIQQAVAQVSAVGTLYYASSHVGYALLRRRNARSGRAKWFTLAALFCLGAGLLVAVVVRSWFAILPGAGLAAAVWWHGRRYRPHPDLFGLVRKFEQVNAPSRHVPEFANLILDERRRDLAGLNLAKRTLVCQYPPYAAFFIANDFHLKQFCPVLGPDGQGLELYPKLRERLAAGEPLDIFVLHDLLPAGMAFAQKMRAMPRWLGKQGPAAMIDVGLGPGHRADLRHALRPLREIAGALGAHADAKQGEELGAHATAVAPALMLEAMGRALEQRAPLRLGRTKDEGEIDSEGDSE